jgi:lipopolysaccharide biosynthesis protein
MRLRTFLFRSLRLGFRLTPMPASTRDRLRQRFLDRHSSLVPTGPQGRPASIVTLRPYDHSAHRALGFVPRCQEKLPYPLPATVVTFYLPQFHPIPENDAWWGAGFTEWVNVGRALPQFEGHAQPRLPGDLGYYDLRLPEVMREQMKMARDYGIGAFCAYFYWFAGKTLLEAPLKQWLADPSLDLPICLCWANENWSRRWDGRADDVLIGQAHSADDDIAFIEHVSVYLRDRRYLRVEGKPMLLVYRPGLLPEPRATAIRWRAWCRENGVGEIHLAYVQSFDNVDPSSIGFDAAVAFPPNNVSLEPITSDYRLVNPNFSGQVYDWRQLAAQAMATKDPVYRLYPGVNPGWDNEPRRSGRGRSFVRVTPRAFTTWMRTAIAAAQRRSPDAPLVFVNAWNEWAEGAVLEPDIKHGYAWLEAVRKSLRPAVPIQTRACAVVHVWYPDLLEEIATALRATRLPLRIILTVPSEREEAVRNEAARLSLDAEFVVAPNRGRDILPFLRLAGKLLDEGEDVVLKLHTKRSTHRQDGAAWRAELLDRLVAPDRAAAIVGAFADDPKLGVVAPEGHMQPLSFYWGANAANVEYLCALAGVPQPRAESDQFVAGSMFWCRLSALAPLIDTPLSSAEFAPEAGQVDGTLAHAVERMILLTAEHQGFRAVSAASLMGIPEPKGPYAYARRT